MRKSLILAFALAGCGGGGDNEVAAVQAAAAPPPPSAPTVSLEDYLVPWMCPSGRPELAEPGCASRPFQAADVQAMRLHDLPGSNSGPEAYHVGGGWVLRPGRYVVPFSYAPWRAWTLPDDGGEVYAAEGDRARAVATQDGGKPYLQVFQGPECGGDGWLLFVASDLRTGSWASRVARLTIGKVGDACHPMGSAFTRYRIEDVDWPITIDGKPETRRLSTIISQHFDHATVGESQAMEEFYFARHAGRLRWTSYTRGAPVGADLDMRCPPRPFTGEPGFRLNDCRDLTNLRTDDAGMSGDRYGWPKEPVP